MRACARFRQTSLANGPPCTLSLPFIFLPTTDVARFALAIILALNLDLNKASSFIATYSLPTMHSRLVVGHCLSPMALFPMEPFVLLDWVHWIISILIENISYLVISFLVQNKIHGFLVCGKQLIQNQTFFCNICKLVIRKKRLCVSC